MAVEPREQFTERITVRTRPSQRRQIETAARLAGVSKSRLLREGGLQAAREVIQQETSGEGSAPAREGA